MSLLAQDERLARKVGAGVIVVLVAAICFFVFVLDHLEWGRPQRLKVCFGSSGGLREGASVIVAGRQFGAVESIALTPRDGVCGHEGVVVTIAMPRRNAARVTAGGDVFIAARGVLGERYLELGPAPADGPSLADRKDPLAGSDPPSIDRVLHRTWNNLVIAQEFAREVKPELDLLRAQLADTEKALDDLAPATPGVGTVRGEASALLAEARTLRDVGLGGGDGIAKLGDVIDRSRTTLARLDATLELLQGRARTLVTASSGMRTRLATRGPQAVAAIENTITQLRATSAKLDPLLAGVRDITGRLARGEGSLGRLARDPEFPEDAKQLGKILKRQPWKIFARPEK